MDWAYLNERIDRYNANPSDDLLYRIGSHVDILRSEEKELSPERRYRILNWIAVHACLNTDIDLALLIFGRQQLEQWLDRSRQAYPDFEFYLCFEYQSKSKTGWESGINHAIFWLPYPGSPMPETDNDFPYKPYWDTAEHFWLSFPGGFTNEFDFTLDCYPSQDSFTRRGWVCEVDDWYTMLSEEEVDLMPVAQVLQHFARVE